MAKESRIVHIHFRSHQIKLERTDSRTSNILLLLSSMCLTTESEENE